MTDEEWDEMRKRIEGWEAWRQQKLDAEKRKNCTHPRLRGSGSVSSDGSSHSTWYCPDCGDSGETKTPPRTDGEGLRAMLTQRR